jgi:hypothetical protein
MEFNIPVHTWDRPGWIAITYVCRYWRTAALNLRELWSSITPRLSISWSRTMIERSSPLPMCIKTTYGLKTLPGSELLSSSRIRTLHISGYPRDVLELLNNLSSPSPALESLSLRFPDRGDHFEIPEALCSGDAPHLRRLTFDSNAYIRVPLWLLTNITHFTNNMCISLDKLFETLKEMPRLEVLCIVRTFGLLYRDFTDPREHSQLLPRTKLPCLSLLYIRDRIPNTLSMLYSCIDGPPTLRRHFFWQNDLDMWPSWDWTLSTLQPFVPRDSSLGANDGGLQMAQICRHDCKSFEMWSRTYFERASTASREDALFLLQVEWPSRNPVDSCFPNLSLYFSNSAYMDLTISPESGFEGAGTTSKNEADALIIVERWTELLTDLPFVKTLRLHRGSYACILVLRALSASESPILPHLRRVIVFDSAVHFAAPALPDEAGDGCSVASRNFVQANVGPELVEAVNLRPGLEVVLAGCEVDEELLDTLRKRARVYIGHERVYV